MRLKLVHLGLLLMAVQLLTSCKSRDGKSATKEVPAEEVFCEEGPVKLSSKEVYTSSDGCNVCSCGDLIPDEDPMLICTTKTCPDEEIKLDGCIIGGVLLKYDAEVPGNDDCTTYKCNKDGQLACIDPKDGGKEKKEPKEAPKPDEEA